MSDDDLYDLAEEAATKAGHVQRCPHHDDVLLIVGDDESERKGYAIATNMAKEKELDLAKMREALADVIRDAVMDCPYPPLRSGGWVMP
jgi:hypothetical protein